eukprot:6187242-Pleurochrysis_carterae.AAC.3
MTPKQHVRYVFREEPDAFTHTSLKAGSDKRADAFRPDNTIIYDAASLTRARALAPLLRACTSSQALASRRARGETRRGQGLVWRDSRGTCHRHSFEGTRSKEKGRRGDWAASMRRQWRQAP